MTVSKLSETLDGPRSPDQCQACGARWVELIRWYECDDDDRPTRVVVVTCKRCERTVIVPHDRLYQQLDPDEHHPGSMPLCVLCRCREGVSCPRASYNGGPGVEVAPAPSRVHFKAVKRSLSGWHTLWRPAAECSGREVLQVHSPDHPDI